MATRFPEEKGQRRCKDSFRQLATTFRSMPSKNHSIDPDVIEKSWRPCDTDYSEYAKGWRTCRATWPGKRGFTCGLWTLFHSLAAQSDDRSALQDLQTLRSAIQHFFSCRDCAEHFINAIPAPKDQDLVTRKDAQLWWWNAHNSVNRRVMAIEKKFEDADPQFPKVAWWPSPKV